MFQSNSRVVPWLTFAHLPHTTIVRWLPSRSIVLNNIARPPWSIVSVRWRTVMAVLELRPTPRVNCSMELLPILKYHFRYEGGAIKSTSSLKPHLLFIHKVPSLYSRFNLHTFVNSFLHVIRSYNHNTVI